MLAAGLFERFCGRFTYYVINGRLCLIEPFCDRFNIKGYVVFKILGGHRFDIVP